MTSTVPVAQGVRDALAAQTIELPSWAFGNSGTRFKVFSQRGLPRPLATSVPVSQGVTGALAGPPTARPPRALGASGPRCRGSPPPGVPRAPSERPAAGAQPLARVARDPRLGEHLEPGSRDP